MNRQNKTERSVESGTRLKDKGPRGLSLKAVKLQITWREAAENGSPV